MQRTGVANLPLHPGRAPRWLFTRMVKLSKAILDVLVIEYGSDEVLKRFSDPFWFQALSCVLGFDWHSSGTTTVTCGALKEAINPEEHGIAIAGGKGKASRKTPQEIEETASLFSLSSSTVDSLKSSSRLAAKVDNAALQDGYQLYHHVFFFSEKGKWAVVQQGMNSSNSYARRYHWFSECVESFVVEPHNAIVGDKRETGVLDMTSRVSEETRKTSVDLVKTNPYNLRRDWETLIRSNKQTSLDVWFHEQDGVFKPEVLDMPRGVNWSLIKRVYDFQPKNYEELISIKGVGPSTVRALALISDLIYGAKPSWEDPVKFTFTVGGKDGVPYPVDRKVMDESIEILRRGVEEAKVEGRDKLKALRRLKSVLRE
ncbi:MAG TPA: DUF763 domain-containing protein [Thermoplasmatales archaeon]|nr:DUF763 domain-containing protein [Thermoplasmatales archaeon]